MDPCTLHFNSPNRMTIYRIISQCEVSDEMEVDFDKVEQAFSCEGEAYALLSTDSDSGAGVVRVFRDDTWEMVDDPTLILTEGAVMSIPMLKALLKDLDSTNAR